MERRTLTLSRLSLSAARMSFSAPRRTSSVAAGWVGDMRRVLVFRGEISGGASKKNAPGDLGASYLGVDSFLAGAIGESEGEDRAVLGHVGARVGRGDSFRDIVFFAPEDMLEVFGVILEIDREVVLVEDFRFGVEAEEPLGEHLGG